MKGRTNTDWQVLTTTACANRSISSHVALHRGHVASPIMLIERQSQPPNQCLKTSMGHLESGQREGIVVVTRKHLIQLVSCQALRQASRARRNASFAPGEGRVARHADSGCGDGGLLVLSLGLRWLVCWRWQTRFRMMSEVFCDASNAMASDKDLTLVLRGRLPWRPSSLPARRLDQHLWFSVSQRATAHR